MENEEKDLCVREHLVETEVTAMGIEIADARVGIDLCKRLLAKSIRITEATECQILEVIWKRKDGCTIVIRSNLLIVSVDWIPILGKQHKANKLKDMPKEEITHPKHIILYLS